MIRYRKRAVIAFAPFDDRIAIIGVFYGGRDYAAILRETGSAPASVVKRMRLASFWCVRIAHFKLRLKEPMTMSTAPIATVRPLNTSDESRWRELFRGYRDFYRLPESEDVVSRVWGWLMDPAHECEALVAETEAGVVALGHYRRFSRPSTGTVGIWLDDLFTAPEARGSGAGRALISGLADIAGSEDRSVVRWITAHDNLQAQALYDQIATPTEWVTYDKPPTAR